ncbi:MAG: hypothetical protein KBF89_05360 [Acidimicrobiia bacterium]|nr:hypothetical protein [Acidimicrobiia bacterium]
MDMSILMKDEYATIAPDATKIPGAERLLTIVNGIGGWGLILCVAAIVIAAIIWAFGAQSQNQAQATQGKKGVLVAILCAAIIIAAPQLIKWGASFGKEFKG